MGAMNLCYLYFFYAKEKFEKDVHHENPVISSLPWMPLFVANI